MADWKPIVEDPPPVGCKFIALYNDGSGAIMFLRVEGGFIDSDGDELSGIGEGCDLWIELPQNKEFWCEVRSEDPMTLYTHPPFPEETTSE